MEIREKWESCLQVLRPETMEVKTTCKRAKMINGKLYTDPDACASCRDW